MKLKYLYVVGCSGYEQVMVHTNHTSNKQYNLYFFAGHPSWRLERDAAAVMVNGRDERHESMASQVVVFMSEFN